MIYSRICNETADQYWRFLFEYLDGGINSLIAKVNSSAGGINIRLKY